MKKNTTGFIKRFAHALDGLLFTIGTEPNMKIHLTATALIIAGGVYVGLAPWKWAVLLLTINLVLVSEIINTAIETAVDLSIQEFHPLAKRAKDIAAGAVLLSALIAAITGLVIFLV